MDDYIPISSLNDFIFCPYSIYLHNVYMDADEDLFHAVPQTRGKAAHEGVDQKTYSTRRTDWMSLPVVSERHKIFGKIDLFKQDKGLLIERKYQLSQIYRGQIYQLWAQCICMQEMGFEVKALAFYEISTNKMIPIEMPGEQGTQELLTFLERYRSYKPDAEITVNANKCLHCVYCNLCDKTDSDNVY